MSNDDSYWNSDYFRNKRRYETTYSRDSPYEQMREQRGKINLATWESLDNRGVLPPPLACTDHPHIPIQYRKSDGKPFCRDCGFIEEPKPQPTVKKESKVKQKQTNASPTFIKQLPERKKKGGKLGNEDLSSELSDAEYSYIAGIYGNVTDFSES